MSVVSLTLDYRLYSMTQGMGFYGLGLIGDIVGHEVCMPLVCGNFFDRVCIVYGLCHTCWKKLYEPTE